MPNIDKAKLLEWLNDEISSCEIVNNENDKSIAWVCKRVIGRINAGTFDVVPTEHERAYWAREGLIKRQQEQLNQAIELLSVFVKRTALDHSYIHTPEYMQAKDLISSKEGKDKPRWKHKCPILDESWGEATITGSFCMLCGQPKEETEKARAEQ